MSLVITEGIVLRTYNLDEADKIVVCLTRQNGIIRGTARGARRLKSKFGAGLEPCTILSLSYYERENRELVSLKDVNILRSYFGLAQTGEKTQSLAYLCELALEFSPPNEPNPHLYRLLYACLEAIAEATEVVTPLLLYFEIWLLKLSGFLPDLRYCTDCRIRLKNLNEAYLDANGIFRCERCSGKQGALITRSAINLLNSALKLSPVDFALAFTEQESTAVASLTGGLIHKLIKRVLEKELRSQVRLN
jgi:DNA repair protein RecO (recombination protein O)